MQTREESVRSHSVTTLEEQPRGHHSFGDFADLDTRVGHEGPEARVKLVLTLAFGLLV